MYFDDHKKAATMIVAKRSAKGGERLVAPMAMKPEAAMMEDGTPDGMHAAAEDILGAHNEKSAMKLAESLRNFIDLHLHSKEGNVPEPDEG